LRILQIISALAGGGAEIFVRDLALSLTQSGHQVAIAYISSAIEQGNSIEIEQDFKSKLAQGGVQIFEIGHKCRRNPLSGAWHLRKIVSAFNPDVVHAHLASALMFLSLTPGRVPIVYTHHNIVIKFGRLMSRWFDRNIDHYIAICSACESVLKTRTNKPMTMIRNGISRRRVAEPSLQRGEMPFRVITVGRISEQKNYISLLAIAKLVKSKAYATPDKLLFQVCGDGAGLEDLRQLANELAVDDIVQFLGGRSDVPELMAQADLLLMTSLWEGLPITLIEAIHAGIPVISTDVGGCSEVVLHGQTGYLFAPNDNVTAAEHLCELWRDREKRLAMGLAAKTLATEFDMDTVCSKHVQVYQRLVAATL
jgi:glycosyltransferase involved in cell wall biosynthesis